MGCRWPPPPQEISAATFRELCACAARADIVLSKLQQLQCTCQNLDILCNKQNPHDVICIRCGFSIQHILPGMYVTKLCSAEDILLKKKKLCMRNLKIRDYKLWRSKIKYLLQKHATFIAQFHVAFWENTRCSVWSPMMTSLRIFQAQLATAKSNDFPATFLASFTTNVTARAERPNVGIESEETYLWSVLSAPGKG